MWGEDEEEDWTIVSKIRNIIPLIFINSCYLEKPWRSRTRKRCLGLSFMTSLQMFKINLQQQQRQSKNRMQDEGKEKVLSSNQPGCTKASLFSRSPSPSPSILRYRSTFYLSVSVSHFSCSTSSSFHSWKWELIVNHYLAVCCLYETKDPKEDVKKKVEKYVWGNNLLSPRFE